MEKEKNFSPRLSASRMVEEVLGCKWSLAVLAAIRQGIRRPGALERAIAGISTKVLNERLRKLVRYGVLYRHSYPEVPPRVEYGLTPFGEHFVAVLEAIERLEEKLAAPAASVPAQRHPASSGAQGKDT